MLVLSRKLGESIVIADETIVRVISVNGNKVRLGIEAPGWVKIMRAELLAPRDGPAPLQDQPESLGHEMPSTG